MRDGDPDREPDVDARRAPHPYRLHLRKTDIDQSAAPLVGYAGDRTGYLSSTSSMRQPLKRLQVIVVSPVSRGCMQVANRE
jgi:hypothetical protein